MWQDSIKELRKKVVSTETFIEEAIILHGNKYDYTNVCFQNLSSTVKVSCPIHGEFEIKAHDHLEGKGCPKCIKSDKFVEKVREKFGDKFGFQELVYENTNKPVTLICSKHRKFTGMPGAILATRCGCPECGKELRSSEQIQHIIKNEIEKEEERMAEQQKLDRIYDQLKGFNVTTVDSIEQTANKIVSILNELDETILDKVNSILQELRRQRHICEFHKEDNISTISIPKSFVAIDFETLYPQRVSACSIGMVKYKEGIIVDRFYSLIRPPFDYTGKKGNVLTWIHGIKEEDVINERTFPEILQNVEDFIEGLPLVAHNACVEKACLRDSLDYYGLTSSIEYENILDTYYLSLSIEHNLRMAVVGKGSHSLDAVCRRFHVQELEHHNALADAEMCGNLLLAFNNILLGEKYENKEPHTISNKKKYNASDMVQRIDMWNIDDNPFKNTNVVLTGFPVSVSQEHGHSLKELGAKVCSSVSNKTDWLICGSNPGPAKLEKAKLFGARIISEAEFLELIKTR